MAVFGGCKAARTVSGDYYDFIVEDETHLNIVVGDISGKGISAALLMANLQAAMRSQLLSHKHEDPASVGQSLADVNASTGKVVLKAILDDLKDAKWIAPSSDAPKGYKEPIVNIKNGNTMVCSVEVKVSTGIKFIPISFLVTPITDSSN